MLHVCWISSDSNKSPHLKWIQDWLRQLLAHRIMQITGQANATMLSDTKKNYAAKLDNRIKAAVFRFNFCCSSIQLLLFKSRKVVLESCQLFCSKLTEEWRENIQFTLIFIKLQRNVQQRRAEQRKIESWKRDLKFQVRIIDRTKTSMFRDYFQKSYLSAYNAIAIDVYTFFPKWNSITWLFKKLHGQFENILHFYFFLLFQ